MRKVHLLKSAHTYSYLTIEEAAQILGIKSTVIRNYLYDGKLTTQKFKTLTLLDANEVKAWKKKPKTRKHYGEQAR